jgi:hypothetical protein
MWLWKKILLQIYNKGVTTLFWPAPPRKKTTLILPTPRTFFGSFRNVLPFPVRMAYDLAIARRTLELL